MANTFLDNKISSFIEDKFPEFIRTDHPVFVEFLRLYYQFLETAKITLSSVQAQDNVLLENLLTDNFVLLEDGTKIYTEDSEYGAFEKGETVAGQISGATSIILAEDNNNSVLYVEQNRFFQVGEAIVGSSSGARGTISKYQGNPIQNIQQLLEYANIDRTLTDFLNQFRDAYLTAIPTSLASGVSKRNLVKNVRDLYRAKGTKKGHELFFRLLFNETPEIFYPRENLLKISAGEWSSNTVIRVVAITNDPNGLAGQVISQTIDPTIGAETASATVESVLQLQEGETTIYELILNVDSISGTFVSGAVVTGIDNANLDVAISATIQVMVTGASVTNGGSFYDISDAITVTSDLGRNAKINVVDIGSGSVEEIAIDNPGTGYQVGQDLFFDNTNTEGTGATAKIVNVGGAVAPESGDIVEYGMDISDHIIFEDATEKTDAYTGSQIQLETQTFTDLGVASESNEIVNVLMFSGGSGYERVPTVQPTNAKIFWSLSASTTSGSFQAGETITNQNGVTANIGVLAAGNASIASASGTFAPNDVITGSISYGKATLTSVTQHGTGATFVAWSNTLGSIKGLEVTNFGSGYTTPPVITAPTKFLVTRNVNESSPQDLTLTTSFAVGDTILGKQSTAEAEVISWDNTRQLLSVKLISGNFILGEIIHRGSLTEYAILSRRNTAQLIADVGAQGTSAGNFENDKGKISESLMRIQDSFYYQDFSYVVRVGAAIADWRGSVKKAIHPAGFALFGEVSIASRVSARITSPVTGIISDTPELASLFEAVLTTVVRRKLGTTDDGTSLPNQKEIKGSSYIGTGTIKRSDNILGHEIGQTLKLTEATASGSNATIKTDGEHGISVGEEIQVSGVTTPGYDGYFTATEVTSDSIKYSFLKTLSVTSVTREGSVATATTTNHNGLVSGLAVILSGSSVSGYNGTHTITVISDTQFTFPVSGTPANLTSASITLTLQNLVSPATLGTDAKVVLTRVFDKDTRDLTLRTHKDVTVQTIYSGFDALRANRFGLGATKKTATRYLWSVGATSDTSAQRLDYIPFAYPNLTRRRMPELGTDNVAAGSTGVYNSTFNYTNIQIGSHELNSQMTLDSFRDVPINEIVRPSRFLIGEYDGDDSSIVMEDGNHVAFEDNTEQSIPKEAGKLWNVPPPSYIRGVNISSGEYVSFDDNTTPPDFSDNTAPPSFDATSGT